MTTTMFEILDAPPRLLTAAEYLEMEKHSELRHEFEHGNLIPMAGEAKRANTIANNILVKFFHALVSKGLEMFSHDVKAEVEPGGIYRYPDLVVAPVADDSDEHIVKMPVMLVEVASEESSTRDRVKKRKQYLKIPSLLCYLIIDQDEMLVEMHLRNGQAWDSKILTEPDEVLDLAPFDLQISVHEIYERVPMA